MNNIDTSDHIMSLFSYVDKKAWIFLYSKVELGINRTTKMAYKLKSNDKKTPIKQESSRMYNPETLKR
jgi:hypothetical protein